MENHHFQQVNQVHGNISEKPISLRCLGTRVPCVPHTRADPRVPTHRIEMIWMHLELTRYSRCLDATKCNLQHGGTKL
jgi:hypothetical protein